MVMNDSTTYDHLLHLVTQILNLNKRLATALGLHRQMMLTRQIIANVSVLTLFLL